MIGATDVTRPSAAPDSRGRILVVDDRPTTREILKGVLRTANFEVVDVADGEEALRVIEHAHFDLVVADILMPGIGGLELLGRLRKRHGPGELPVIIVTIKEASDDVVNALQLGANDYVTKPINPAVLLARIDTQLKLRDALAAARAETDLANERNALLEEANEELDAFSVTVSHDLRAPLRSIRGFTEALVEDYGASLDDQGRDYLQRILVASSRMSGLIEDLMALARATRQELVEEIVDLSNLADETWQALCTQRDSPSPTLKIQPGLRLRGDRQLMRIVIENLLENAWKYSAHRTHPAIELGMRLEAGSRVFFVTDNGMGFADDQAEAMFRVFERLPEARDFEGTGIGLAIVQRIIRRHSTLR